MSLYIQSNHLVNQKQTDITNQSRTNYCNILKLIYLKIPITTILQSTFGPKNHSARQKVSKIVKVILSNFSDNEKAYK